MIARGFHPRTTAAKIAVLGALYLAEGLPFGFQAKALPLYLREHGYSLPAISLAGLLSLPWALKFLWAPLVDRWGTRKAWMAPCMIALAATAGIAALLPVGGSFTPFFVLIAAQNLFAATMDVAVDGLAVDLLGPSELGPGNAAQVGGYKLGMLVSGGLLVWISTELGLGARIVFVGTAALTLGALVVALVVASPPRGEPVADRPRLGAIVRTMFRAATAPGTAWLVAIVLTYKLGESMVDQMFKPFLKDGGHDIPKVALWINVPGTVVSIAGSILGGFLVARASLDRALRIAAVARVFPLFALVAAATFGASWPTVVAVAMGEELFGGVLTTVTFALMMSRVDKRIGATHFTALACVELAGKSLGGLPSGFLATWLDYESVFALGAAFSVGFVILVFAAPAREPVPARAAND